MSHKHEGDPMVMKKCCIKVIEKEVRTKRILLRCLLGFSFALAGVCAFVLWKIGMGR